MITIEPRDRQKDLDQAAIATASLSGFMPEVGQYGTGVIKWSGGINRQTGKENDFGFIETKSGDVFFRKSNVLSAWEQLSASTPVVFRCIKGRQGKNAASEVGVFEDFPDEAMLKFLPPAEDATEVAGGTGTEAGLLEVFSVSSGILRCESLKRLVASASEVTLSNLADFIAANLSVDDRGGLLNMLSSPVLLRQEAFALRMLLPRHLHLKVLATLSNLTAHYQEAVSALGKAEDKEYDESIFWNTFSPKHPKDPLYPHAPNWLKGQICRTHYADFVIRWNTLFVHLTNVCTSLVAARVYGSLTKIDRELAALWADKSASEGTLARMLSARAAEIAAMTFYRERGCEAEDVAIGQISRNGQDWRTHDLLIDGTVAIDVKNSRRPMNSKKFYVEHTVPQFKLDRSNRSVRIAGVLSPYVSLAYINEPDSAKFGIDEIVYLGETRADQFEKLVQTYQTPAFTIDRGRSHIVPNWLFDYPAVWYKDYAASVRALVDDCEWPQEDEWHYTLGDKAIEDAFQKIYAIGIDVPGALTTHFHGWKAEFYGRLRISLETLPRLPAIYLTVMRHFVENLSNPSPGFSPADYKPLLFPAGVKNSEMIPLATIDPLCIVKGLIDTLSVLWSKREFLQLGRLVTFRFTGLGILRAKAIDDENWTTILAYCGGSVYRMEGDRIELDSQGKPVFLSKCGHAPLTLGVQRTCNICRYLICDKCQFCCNPCEAVRLAKLAEDEKNVRPINDYRQSDLRDRPAWGAYHEIGDIEVAYSPNEAPVWEIPIEAYENDD